MLQRLACLSLLTAILASCADRPPSTVILALSSEAPLPQGVQSMTIKVRRGGVVYHDETYHVADKADASKKTLLTVDDIPGTLTIQDDGRATGPVSVSVEATLATAGGVSRKTIRAATVSFVDEKQKLLRMPIQLACSDITCETGKACRAGRCMDEVLPESELEDFEEDRARPVAGKCFQRLGCSGQQDGEELRLDIETVVDVLQDDCTVPYIFPNSGFAPKDDELAGITDPADPKLARLRDSINMGYIWSGDYNIANEGKNVKTASWTVVDKDAVEGWNFADVTESTRTNPDATRRVILSEGLCTALKLDREAIRAARQIATETGKEYARPTTRLLGTVELRGCAPKPRNLPECNPGQEGLVSAP